MNHTQPASWNISRDEPYHELSWYERELRDNIASEALTSTVCIHICFCFIKASGVMSSSSSGSPAISGCATKEAALLDVCIEYDIDIDDVDMNNDSHIDWLCDLKNTHEVVSFQVVCECNLNSPRCIRLPGHSQLLIRINSLDPWRAGAYCELLFDLFYFCCLFAGWFVCEFVCLFACLFLLVFCNSQAAGPASSGRLARHQ